MKSYGFSNIRFVNGEHDVRIDATRVALKNRSFLSTCLDIVQNETPATLCFEEDSELIAPGRLPLLLEAIDWATQHPDDWDILYGGCIAQNPAWPTYRLNWLYSTRGQLGGHCMLLSLQTARKYVMDTAGHDVPFDTRLARTPVRTYMLTPAVMCQHNNPGDTPSWLPGKHFLHQDVTLILWPTLFLFLTTMMLVHLVFRK
jgi:hypothetical protein